MIRAAALLAALAAIGVCSPARADEATCSDYVHAQGEDRALFNGYAFGFVAAKMDGRSEAAVNDAVRHVLSMTMKYCTEKPGDRVRNVIGAMSEITAGRLDEFDSPAQPGRHSELRDSPMGRA